MITRQDIEDLRDAYYRVESLHKEVEFYSKQRETLRKEMQDMHTRAVQAGDQHAEALDRVRELESKIGVGRV
jgi:uncharacterized coiled-coil DUF342 family protein